MSAGEAYNVEMGITNDNFRMKETLFQDVRLMACQKIHILTQT